MFRFEDTKHSRNWNADYIGNWYSNDGFENPGDETGDLIDLSAIDADTTTEGNQAFTFGDKGEKGSVWVVKKWGELQVRANTDDDNDFELLIYIYNNGTSASDFTAADFIL